MGGYAPRVLEGAACPTPEARSLTGQPFEGTMFVGAFTPAAIEVGIWVRLIGPDCPVIYFGVDEAAARQVAPPSRYPNTFVASRDDFFRDLVRPDRPERAFAVAGTLIVIGAPTEEVWERFEGILNT